MKNKPSKSSFSQLFTLLYRFFVVYALFLMLPQARAGVEANTENEFKINNLPEGSFHDVCKDVSIDGAILMATCPIDPQDPEGPSLRTALPNLETCVGEISTYGGTLKCLRREVFLADETCTDFEVINNHLRANCETGEDISVKQGETFIHRIERETTKTTLANYRDCPASASISNIKGTLYCAHEDKKKTQQNLLGQKKNFDISGSIHKVGHGHSEQSFRATIS